MSGVVAISSVNNIVKKFYYSLNSIQHRGQDATGMVLSDGKNLNRIKGKGLVHDVYTRDNLGNLNSHFGIGHVRCSPEGCNQDFNIEPLVSFTKNTQFSIAHDGNIINYSALKSKLEEEGISFHTQTDSELILFLITRFYEGDIITAIRETMKHIKGGYSCVLCLPDKVIGFRDPHGIRPLMVGENDEDLIIASENSAIEILSIDDYRDIRPGEIVLIDADGLHSYQMDNEITPKHCIFEYVYTSRSDAYIEKINSYMFRRACGEVLSEESPVEADLVCPVPDSGTPSAIGYAQKSGIPFAEGLVKNRYMGRTFIKSTQEERELAVRLKLNPQKSVIRGKRIILVDDSIVRGTTSAKLIRRIREAGAKEVHIRVTSPPFINPCFYGVDTPDKEKLIASKYNVDQMREIIGADSLEFISLESMLKITKANPNHFCTACFTGDYPIKKEDI